MASMLLISLLFGFCFTQVSDAQGTANLLGFVFGFQRICFCRCGISPGSTRTGRQAKDLFTPHQFPWLAAISNGSHIVGGSLISDRHVITAASPFYGIQSGQITVSLGSHDRCGSAGDQGLNSSIDAVIINPGYSPTNKNNDIALLKLRHFVTFTQFIAPICLPWSSGPQHIGQVAWTASWGLNSTTQNSLCTPRVSVLPIMPYETCLKATTDTKALSSDKGCLGPWGAKSVVCKSDTGSPVMWRWTSGGPFRLVGVVSPASRCEAEALPIYTRVVDHASWIYDNIRPDCQCL